MAKRTKTRTRRLTRGPRKGQVITVYQSNNTEVGKKPFHKRNRFKRRGSIVRPHLGAPSKATRKVRSMKRRFTVRTSKKRG